MLTVHLKRFTPTGRKLTYPLKYPENLKLGPYMSSVRLCRSFSLFLTQGKGRKLTRPIPLQATPDSGPSYRLYGLILHSGSGPHSGHYTSYVRAANDKWYDMNDDFVSPVPKAPLGERNAYVLFYIRERGDALRQAVGAAAAGTTHVNRPNGVGAAVKRARDDDDAVADSPARASSSPAAKRPRPAPGGAPSHAARSSSPPVAVQFPFVAGPRPPDVVSASASAPASVAGSTGKPSVKLPISGSLGGRHKGPGGAAGKKHKVRAAFGGAGMNKPRVIQG